MNLSKFKNTALPKLKAAWIFAKSYMWPAFCEALFIIIFSNLSLIILILLYLLTTNGSKISVEMISSILREAIKAPEILVYVLALLAPASWIMVSNWKGKKHIGFYWLLGCLQFLIILSTAVMYSMEKISAIKNQEFATDLATLCIALGMLIWYITLVYRLWIPDALKVDKKAESGERILNELGVRK